MTPTQKQQIYKLRINDPDHDPFIKDKLLTETGMKYLLKLAIDGLKRLLVNKQFTDSPSGDHQKLQKLNGISENSQGVQ